MNSETRSAMFTLLDRERKDGESVFDAAERLIVAEALARGWTIRRAAELVGVPPTVFFRRVPRRERPD